MFTITVPGMDGGSNTSQLTCCASEVSTMSTRAAGTPRSSRCMQAVLPEKTGGPWDTCPVNATSAPKSRFMDTAPICMSVPSGRVVAVSETG